MYIHINNIRVNGSPVVVDADGKINIITGAPPSVYYHVTAGASMPYTLNWEADGLNTTIGPFGSFEVYQNDGAGNFTLQQVPVTLLFASGGGHASQYLFELTGIESYIYIK